MGYLFVLFLRLVAYFEGTDKIVLFILVSILISISIAINLFNHRKSGQYLIRASVFALVIVLLVMAHTLIIDSLSLRDIAVLTTFFLWYVYVVSKFWNSSLSKSLQFILISFLIYNIANYAYYVIQFSDTKIGMNSILTFLGINGSRIFFPLSSGANINAAQIGLSTLIAIYLFNLSPNSLIKLFYILIYIFQLVLLVLVDSRLILLITILFSILIQFSLARIIDLIKKYWIAISISIVFVMYIFYSTSIFNVIKRPGELSGSVMNRFEIWSISSQIIFDDFRLFTGHGLNGLESSIDNQTKESFSDQNLQTTHNFIIQTVMDWGLIGLTITLYLVGILIKRANRINSQILKLLLAAVLIIGTAEAIPTFYSFEATLLFLGIVAIINTTYAREIN